MTLGISLNSRTLAMAVVQHETLMDFRNRMFKEQWTRDKYQRILDCIRQYIEEQGITHVAVLLPPKHYLNPETKSLLQKIPLLCKERHLPLSSYRVKDLYVLFQNGRAKKRALMQALSLLFPELSKAQKRELANKKRYYTKLFEAVGVATLHERELQAF